MPIRIEPSRWRRADARWERGSRPEGDEVSAARTEAENRAAAEDRRVAYGRSSETDRTGAGASPVRRCRSDRRPLIPREAERDRDRMLLTPSRRSWTERRAQNDDRERHCHQRRNDQCRQTFIARQQPARRCNERRGQPQERRKEPGSRVAPARRSGSGSRTQHSSIMGPMASRRLPTVRTGRRGPEPLADARASGHSADDRAGSFRWPIPARRPTPLVPRFSRRVGGRPRTRSPSRPSP